MDEAVRRAKYNVRGAAEIDSSYHDSYYENTGVQPHASNEALIREMPENVDMVTFGSRCRSIARPGVNRGFAQKRRLD